MPMRTRMGSSPAAWRAAFSAANAVPAARAARQAPLVDGADRDTHGAGDILGTFTARQARNQQLSTFRRQAGILVQVHSVLLFKLLFSQTSAFQSRIE
jgi:hypothetical protein